MSTIGFSRNIHSFATQATPCLWLLHMQETLSPSPGPRVAVLDALRGLAALYVIAFHVSAMPEPHLAAPAWAAPIISKGGTGVALFFVISAFSLCFTWPRHEASGTPRRSFYISRFFRIAPLFFFLLALMIFKDLFRHPHRYSADEIIWNASLLFGISPEWQSGIVMGSWTIGVEVLFYLAFPIIFIHLKSIGKCLAVLLASYVIAYYSRDALPPAIHHFGPNMGLLYQLPLFVLGCLTFRLWEKLKKHAPVRRQLIGNALALSGICIAMLVWYDKTPTWISTLIGGWHFIGIGYAALLLGLLLAPNCLFTNRGIVFLGGVSYSLYLIHPFIISRLYPIFDLAYRHPPSLAYPLSLLTCLALTIPVAWGAYQAIERPGIRLGRTAINLSKKA